MITLTPTAAEQIRASAKQGQMEGMPLRIAAKRDADGTIQYALGFDDTTRDGDTRENSEGIELVVADTSLDLVKGMTIDFVELDDGKQ